ncbi:MAG: 2-phosphosulfolactate phosphatase [Firmicutes bacterium]|nr:2-phosphosulfolactate phosphatase [Bacillota bacterium]
MLIDVLILPQLGNHRELSNKRIVALDVLRATSTIVTALSNGAAEVIPVGEYDEALLLVRSIGRSICLLGGERKGYKIEGFDLGNSPREYTGEKVGGKKIILCTTNGTKAIKAFAGAAEVLIGSYLNINRIVECLLQNRMDTTLVCSGREGKLSLEDLACAGMIARSVSEAGAAELTDAAKAAVFTAKQIRKGGLTKFVSETEHGRYLKKIGMESDLKACTAIDSVPVLPRFQDGRIILIG